MASTAPPESTAATPAQLLLDEEEIQVNRIMKQKPVYKISNSKKKIAADESSPPPSSHPSSSSTTPSTPTTPTISLDEQMKRSRKSIRASIKQSYIIRGEDPSKISDEQIAEDTGNTFHSMWSKVTEKTKSALEKTKSGASKIKTKMDDISIETNVYPSEVLERITGGFPKKKYVSKHASLLPKHDTLAYINKKIKDENIDLLTYGLEDPLHSPPPIYK